MMMPPAAHRYVCRQYELAVDRGLDVGAIHCYLCNLGIVRSPGQVIDDLDNVYCFAGYAANHPAPTVLTVAEADAVLRKPRRPSASGVYIGKGRLQISRRSTCWNRRHAVEAAA